MSRLLDWEGCGTALGPMGPSRTPSIPLMDSLLCARDMPDGLTHCLLEPTVLLSSHRIDEDIGTLQKL